MHHILFEYKRAKHFVARIDNWILDNFNIATRACNLYVKKTMLIGDVFMNDINHLARTQHRSFIHDKNLQSNLPTMKHH